MKHKKSIFLKKQFKNLFILDYLSMYLFSFMLIVTRVGMLLLDSLEEEDPWTRTKQIVAFVSNDAIETEDVNRILSGTYVD